MVESRRDSTPGVTLLDAADLHYFNEGTHARLYEKLGAHPLRLGETQGTYFAVWAPNAADVYVMGDFNSWHKDSHPLQPRGQSGIWEGFLAGVEVGSTYKYHIISKYGGYRVDKADPYGFCHEVSPRTASVVAELWHNWGDQTWMAERARRNALAAPMAIYELHLGSWQRVPEEGNRPLSYRELAPRLAEYVQRLGFTHVEFLPVMEHPFYGSWGYEITGFFAPTSLYGKGSLLSKMPGNDAQKYAHLRLLLGYMYAQAGKKLLFMGGEFGQWREWHHDSSLDWHLLEFAPHAGLQRWVADLNHFYQQMPALYEGDSDPLSFSWIDCNDVEGSIVSFLRQRRSSRESVLVVCNFTPVARLNYQVGAPYGGVWREVLNSDARDYEGGGYGNQGEVEAAPVPHHGRPYSLTLTLPPLGIVFFTNP